MVKAFDQRNKRVFRSATETVYIPFGRVSVKDPKFGILGGKMKLAGDELAKFYEPSLKAAVDHITQCILASPVKVSTVYVVGGLSGSLYFMSELSRRISEAVIKIRVPSDSNVKAAALGALSFYLDHHVEARVAKYAYGITTADFYNANDPEHIQRLENCYTPQSGHKLISGGFTTILRKSTVVRESTRFTKSLFKEIDEDQYASSNFAYFDETCILAYSGPREAINWLDEIDHKHELHVACTIKTNLSSLRSIAAKRKGYNGRMYRRIDFSVVLWFGGPELKAQLHWTEFGVEKWGPVSIIYDDDCVSEEL